MPAPLWALAGVVPAVWLAAFVCMITTGPTMVLMQRMLGLSEIQTVMMLGGFLLAAAVGLPLGVLAGRRFPHAVTLVGLSLMVVGMVLTALAPTFLLVISGRVLTGLGAGAVGGAAAALIGRVAPDRRRTVALVTGGVTLAAAVLGGVIGAVVSEALGFRLVFLLATVLALLAGAVTAVVAIARLVGGGPAAPPMRPGQ